MSLQPYLFFEGRCEEAINYYCKHLDAEVNFMMRYQDSPETPPPGKLPANTENKIMHASLQLGEAVLMVSDGLCTGQPAFQGFSLSLSCADETQAGQIFTALAAGGQISMPLGKTFWSSCFGMVTDRFGVGWMITIAEEQATI